MIKERLLKKEILKEKIVKIVNITISIFIIILICGCSKNSFTCEDFIEKMEDNNYTAVDLSDKDNKMVLAVGDHYQIYFYEFDNNKDALKDLKKNIKDYSNVKNNKDKDKNIDTYIIENENIYTIYVLKDNTYIYISSTSNYKKDINKLLEGIGYQYSFQKDKYML